MTIRESLMQELECNGMSAAEAQATIALAMRPTSEGGMTQLQRRIDDSLEGYPGAFGDALNIGIRKYALEYIDANIPGAWFRSLFDADQLATLVLPS